MQLQHVLILFLVFGGVGLGVWGIVRLVVRRRGSRSAVGVVDYDAARPSRVHILIQTGEGPAFVPGYYDPRKHGYTIQDAFFPQEFCKAVGHNTLILATHMLMPGDGNTAHGGDWEDLQLVPQASWTAAWTDYDRARRRLNWDAVWSRGDGSLAGLKNIANGLMVVVLLILMFKSFSQGSTLGSLQSTSDMLVTQFSLLTNTTKDGKPLPVSQSVAPIPRAGGAAPVVGGPVVGGPPASVVGAR
jgi:hypothetical protein